MINNSSISDAENDSIRIIKECNFIIEKNKSKNVLNHTVDKCNFNKNGCLSQPVYSFFPAIYIILSIKLKVCLLAPKWFNYVVRFLYTIHLKFQVMLDLFTSISGQ